MIPRVYRTILNTQIHVPIDRIDNYAVKTVHAEKALERRLSLSCLAKCSLEKISTIDKKRYIIFQSAFFLLKFELLNQ